MDLLKGRISTRQKPNGFKRSSAGPILAVELYIKLCKRAKTRIYHRVIPNYQTHLVRVVDQTVLMENQSNSAQYGIVIAQKLSNDEVWFANVWCMYRGAYSMFLETLLN